MREPSFWWNKPGLKSTLLKPAALGYGAVAAKRLRKPGTVADVPVICIGNWTHGGTGKTPTAIAIAALLSELGEQPFFLSRGYGGKLTGPLQVDPAVHRASDVGDEPLLLAKKAPTIVSADRVAGARAASAAGASVIVMDDGLQNPSLAKTLAIAVFDARRGLGNGAVFPAGPLRAPLKVQLERTDAVLLLGAASKAASDISDLTRGRGLPFFRGRLEPDDAAVKALARRKVLAFAGIGDPEKFFSTLAMAGVEATVEESFPDHHPYTRADAQRLLERSESGGLTPVTTEKDFVRLYGDEELVKLASRTRTLPVSLVIQELDDMRRLLKQKLAGRK